MSMITREHGALREQVVAALRAEIIDGRLAPGEPLRTEVVMQRFGVSNSPLREAFAQLASEGLVVVQRNRGAQVAPLTREAAADVFRVGGLLLEYVLRWGLPRFVPGDVAVAAPGRARLRPRLPQRRPGSRRTPRPTASASSSSSGAAAASSRTFVPRAAAAAAAADPAARAAGLPRPSRARCTTRCSPRPRTATSRARSSRSARSGARSLGPSTSSATASSAAEGSSSTVVATHPSIVARCGASSAQGHQPQGRLGAAARR